jgi:hypothetical protein
MGLEDGTGIVFILFYFLVIFICIYIILPHEIRFGMGVTRNRLQYTWVWVRCVKI